MNDKIEMPPLPNEEQTNQTPADNYVEEEPVHKLPEELAQAQAIQREAEEQATVEIPETPEPEPLGIRITKSPQDSFNELKKAKTRAERERDEALARLQAYESAKSKNVEPEEDLNVQLGENEYAEGKHIAKLVKKVSRLEQQTREAEQRAYEIATEARLKVQYPDIDRILSSDNIAALRNKHPELAYTLNANTDFYNKAIATYTMIKNLGIAGETETGYANEAKIKANLAKPRPLASIAPQKSESPLTRVNAFAEGLTDDLAKQLRKEMADSMRNH